MKKQTILLTGGAGFIGFHVARALLKQHVNIIIIDNLNNYYSPKLKKARLKELAHSGDFVFYKSDLANINKTAEIFEKHKFDKICHLAGQSNIRYSFEKPLLFEKSNNLATLNLLELAKKHAVKHLVFASSSSLYQHTSNKAVSEISPIAPLSVYAASKLAMEHYASIYHKQFGINCTGLRLFTVYGPWGRPDMAVYKFTENILQNKPIELLSSLKVKRDFTYIDDIVDGILAALKKSYPFEIINLGNHHPVSLHQLINHLEVHTPKKASIKHLSHDTKEARYTNADISKAFKLLNYAPKTTLKNGIEKFVEWYRTFHKI